MRQTEGGRQTALGVKRRVATVPSRCADTTAASAATKRSGAPGTVQVQQLQVQCCSKLRKDLRQKRCRPMRQRKRRCRPMRQTEGGRQTALGVRRRVATVPSPCAGTTAASAATKRSGAPGTVQVQQLQVQFCFKPGTVQVQQ